MVSSGLYGKAMVQQQTNVPTQMVPAVITLFRGAATMEISPVVKDIPADQLPIKSDIIWEPIQIQVEELLAGMAGAEILITNIM